MNTLTDLLLGVGQPRVSHFPDLCTLLYTYLSTEYWTKIVYYLFTQTSPVAHTSALTPTYIKSQKLPNWPISKELGLGRMLLPHWKLLFTMFPSSYHHEIFRSYYQCQKWCPCKRSRSKVKVTEVKTQFCRFWIVTTVWIHIWWWNHAQSLMLLRWGALLLFKVIRQISRTHGTKNRRFWPKLSVSAL